MKLFTSFLVLTATFLFSLPASATVTFVGATNSVTLFETLTGDQNEPIFVFKGIAQGEESTITFSTDTDCPYIAVAGGAKITAPWTCAGGAITVSVSYQGGLSFGPATDQNAGSFYIDFNTPPAPEGSNTPPTDLKGIQMSIYGDVSRWNLSGNVTPGGAEFGVELAGEQGAEQHFLMELPLTAVTFLGGVLGVSVDGRPYPFASVTTKDDGSVALAVDIANLQSTSLRRVRAGGSKTITKKIIAKQRALGIAASKNPVKSGNSFSLAMCAGTSFTAGDKVQVKFLLNKQSSSSFKNATFVLDQSGCAKRKVKTPSGVSGSLVSKISYKGAKASVTTKLQ